MFSLSLDSFSNIDTMDPAQWSPPDVHLIDRVSYYQPGVSPSPHFSPLVSAARSASQEQPGFTRPILQMSHETFRRETFHSLMAHQTGVDISASPPRVANPLRRMFDSDPQNQQSVELPMSTLMNPFQAQTQTPPRLVLLPAVCPSPLNLRSLSPAALRVPVEPTSCLWRTSAPQDYHQPRVTFLPLSPCTRHDLSPCVLVPLSSPVQFRSDPYSPPGPFFISPEYHPSRYLCPQMIPVHQNFSPVLVSSKKDINIINVTVVPPSVMNQKHAETQDKQHEVNLPQNTEAQGQRIEQDRQELQVSAEPPVVLEKTVIRQEACEDCMNALRSLCPKSRENEDEDEEDKLETEVIGNSSFLEYLDNLCNDENFVRNVGSVLNTDYLNSLLSSDPEPFNLSDLERQHQEIVGKKNSDTLSAINNPFIEKDSSPTSSIDGRLRYLNSVPKSDQTGEDSPDDTGSKNSWCVCSPFLPSCLLKEQADWMNNMSSSHEENCSTVCPYCAFFLDYMTLSDKEPEQQESSSYDGPLDLTTAKGYRRQQRKINFNKHAEKSEKHHTFTDREKMLLELVVRKEASTESETKPKTCIVLRRCQRLSGQSKKAEKYVVVRPEEQNQTENRMYKMDEFTPKKNWGDYKNKRRQFSGRRRLFKREESDCKEKMNTAERSETAESKEQNNLKKKNYKAQRGKPFNFCKEMTAILFKAQEENKEESQTPKVVKSRPKSTATEEKVKPTKVRAKNSKRELETVSEPQSLLVPSPMKRRKTKGESSEKVQASKKSSTAQKVKCSGNAFSTTRSKKHLRVEEGGQKD
ncbi:uncharacterized protein LOC119617243 [Kryptolebias marmoratus]|uniref:uncharacterized protein LOC119617243 n=1 Tax=Kryptolebias marmoratus TaxID=37003 RepID=UPI0018AC9F10|nr:uncharacterized protein LOC119617243 [Kryptolebias marmoratus]